MIRFGYVDAEIAGSSAAEEVQMEEANEGEMLQTAIGIRDGYQSDS